MGLVKYGPVLKFAATIKYATMKKGTMRRYTLDLSGDTLKMPVSLAASLPVREQALFHLEASRNLASLEWALAN